MTAEKLEAVLTCSRLKLVKTTLKTKTFFKKNANSGNGAKDKQ